MKLQIEINENVDFIIVFRKINDASREAIPEVPSIKETTAQSDENPLNYRQTAKLLGVSDRFLTRFLVENGYAYRGADGNAYAFDKYVEHGLFRNAHYHSHNGHHGIQTRITKKGIAFIAKLLQAETQK